MQDITAVSCSQRFKIRTGRTKLYSAWQGEYVSCTVIIWLCPKGVPVSYRYGCLLSWLVLNVWAVSCFSRKPDMLLTI